MIVPQSKPYYNNTYSSTLGIHNADIIDELRLQPVVIPQRVQLLQRLNIKQAKVPYGLKSRCALKSDNLSPSKNAKSGEEIEEKLKSASEGLRLVHCAIIKH